MIDNDEDINCNRPGLSKIKTMSIFILVLVLFHFHKSPPNRCEKTLTLKINAMFVYLMKIHLRHLSTVKAHYITDLQKKCALTTQQFFL